ncbi:MAG: PPC domain-containing protein [Planctomycetales bacterium]
MNRSLTTSATMILLLILLTASPALANMVKNIEAVRPRIGQRGTTVDVSIRGISLTDPRQVIFFRPGIKAIDLQQAQKVPRQGFAHGGTIIEEVRCRFEIAADCVPGEYAFRLLTATELTCIGTFHVSPFRVIDEGEPNNAYSNDSPETAMPVEGNVTVRGQLGNGSRTDRDVYRVIGKAGERLSVEVDSARIADLHYGDSEFDLAVRILDSNGRVLAANDDNSLHVQDPVVAIKLPSSGPVFVEVRRSIFAPRETLYGVHIGDFRRPRAAFPPGGQAGTEQPIRLLGDPLGDYEESVALVASGSSSRTVNYFGDAPSALKIRSSPFPNLLENEASDVTRVEKLPVALNGIIDSPTDRDAFQFSATKGQKLRVRVFAASLGSPIDAMILIRSIDENGSPGPVEVELDDSPLHDHDIFGTGFRGGGGLQEAIDPSIVWEAKTDSDYLLEIRDPSGSGGPTAVYRIEIETPQTIVQTLLSSRTFDWTESTRVSGLAVPRGNRWTVDFSLPRGQWDPIGCDYDLIANGLPKGIRLITPRVPAGASRWPLQFEADESAPTTGAVFTLEARPVDDSQKVETRSQQNVPFINHSGGDAWRTVRTEQYIIGVTDPAPFSITVDQPTVAIVRGGELAIPVRITRHNGFTGSVAVRCGNVPRSISTPPPIIVPPEQSECVMQLGAQSNAPLEPLPFYVLGSTVRDDIDDFLGTGHVRASSKIVTLKVAQPFVELLAQPESIRRGESKPFVWSIRQLTPFEGQAKVTLLGLPKGLSIVGPAPMISSTSTEARFQLKATSEALLGQATGLTCEVRIPIGSQHIVQRTGKGILRIDPAASQ